MKTTDLLTHIGQIDAKYVLAAEQAAAQSHQLTQHIHERKPMRKWVWGLIPAAASLAIFGMLLNIGTENNLTGSQTLEAAGDTAADPMAAIRFPRVELGPASAADFDTAGRARILTPAESELLLGNAFGSLPFEAWGIFDREGDVRPGEPRKLQHVEARAVRDEGFASFSIILVDNRFGYITDTLLILDMAVSMVDGVPVSSGYSISDLNSHGQYATYLVTFNLGDVIVRIQNGGVAQDSERLQTEISRATVALIQHGVPDLAAVSYSTDTVNGADLSASQAEGENTEGIGQFDWATSQALVADPGDAAVLTGEVINYQGCLAVSSTQTGAETIWVPAFPQDMIGRAAPDQIMQLGDRVYLGGSEGAVDGPSANTLTIPLACEGISNIWGVVGMPNVVSTFATLVDFFDSGWVDYPPPGVEQAAYQYIRIREANLVSYADGHGYLCEWVGESSPPSCLGLKLELSEPPLTGPGMQPIAYDGSYSYGLVDITIFRNGDQWRFVQFD